MSKQRLSHRLVPCLLVLPLALVSHSTSPARGKSNSSSITLTRSVMGAGAVVGAGPRYRLAGTLGQSSPVGISTAEDATLRAGFWNPFDPTVTGVVSDLPNALRTALHGNHPNPFNPSTRIEFSLAEQAAVRLEIYNLKGERVRALLRGVRPTGRQHAQWDGTDDQGNRVASGVYLYRLQAGSYESTKKMLMLK